jgi:hypothetical protein
MSLRIACDLDGTLADMDAALQQHAVRLFGPEVDLRMTVQAPIGRTGGAGESVLRRPPTTRETRLLWSEIRRLDDFWVSLSEIEPGAVARLGALAGTHRWEVLFVTQRPATAGDTAQRQSQRWLREHGFDLPSVAIVTGSRGRLAANLDLHAAIDDRPEHCADIRRESQTRPVLVWRHRPATLPPSVARLDLDVVSTVTAAFDILEDMTRRAARPSGVWGRLRHAIGVP